MTVNQRIDAFCALGGFLKQFSKENNALKQDSLNDFFYSDFKNLITQLPQYNPWFTENNVRLAITAIADCLNKSQLATFVNTYEQNITQDDHPQRVAVIMAGNIPLVGFHDFLCVLLSGNIFMGKLSSDDKYLLPFLSKILNHINPEFNSYIEFTEGQLKNMDAVIATGSNNTSRYFDYYFSKYPSIIRKNRNSVAVLTGNETTEELKNLGQDIFQYFGLGCRNVSKIFIPRGFKFDLFFESIIDFQDIINNNKYCNNYDYNRTIYLMSNEPGLLDNNFLILKESSAYASPIGVLFYEFYDDLASLNKKLVLDNGAMQCIVSSSSEIQNSVKFGQTQCPSLEDYADGIDTMQFLTSLGKA